MIVFYFDTSALVKRYRKEAGSEVLDRVFKLEKHAFATCFWTVLEFIVAFSARRRRGELSGKTFNVLISRFLKDILDRFIVISVDDELVASAASTAIKHALPSADCLQLASVLSLKHALKHEEGRVVLLCSDKDLRRAAKEEGVETIDPEEENSLEELERMLESQF